MQFTGSPTLTADEIDDLLYFTRVNEAQELSQTVADLGGKYSCKPGAIVQGCIDPESGNTALHYCSANGLADLLPTLLDELHSSSGADSESDNSSTSFINRKNTEGNTALHWAAYNGQLACVKLLIAAGADMWIKNAAGHLAMFEAERADKSDVVQYLLEIGGEAVETAGTEKQPTAEDVAEAAGAEASSSSEADRGADPDAMDVSPHG